MSIEESSRTEIKTFLPEALANAIRSYDSHMRETQPKDLAKHHATGKVVVAHIELLLKLARWADGEADGGAEKDAILMALIGTAEGELQAHIEKEKAEKQKT